MQTDIVNSDSAVMTILLWLSVCMHCIEWWYFQWPWRTPNPVQHCKLHYTGWFCVWSPGYLRWNWRPIL